VSATPVRGIGQLAINCADIARATRFYRDVLGLPLLFEAGGMAFFDCGGTRLMLTRPSSPELDHPASPIYFRVQDIEQRMAAMQAAGTTIRRPPQATHRDARHELWIGWFEDGEGNLLALMEEKPAAAG
jgi:catechol 2,3-dioxygenase-like lactoylglutathione lyase family enzyme